MISQRTKKYIIVIFMLLFIGCNGKDDNYDTMQLKEFLFLNDAITIQLDDGDRINKYNADNEVRALGKILTINKDENRFEILTTKRWQKIEGILNEKYYVRGGGDVCVCDDWGLSFGTRKPKITPEPKINKTIKKEGFEMGLSLGTWILLIIVMIVISKVAHKISLKTIFKPTKKMSKHVSKEWEES